MKLVVVKRMIQLGWFDLNLQVDLWDAVEVEGVKE